MLHSWIPFLLLGLRAAASPVVTRQYEYPEDEPLTAASCIRQSFSNPGWYILGPELIVVDGLTGGSKGDIGFLAFNKATRETARCVAKNIELDPKGPASLDVWHSCNVTGIEFQFELNGAIIGDLELHVRGSWNCQKGSPLVFSSNGTWEVPTIQGCWDDQGSRGLERQCVLGNSQVSGSLSSPVKIAPQLPLRPYTPSQPPFRCVDRSVDPEWTVEHFSYRQSSAGGTEAAPYELALNLTNISTGESVECTASADGKREEGVRRAAPWLKCTPSKAGTLVDLTEVSFDKEYGILGVRQTWRCLDGFEGVDFDSYTGTGYFHTPVKCSEPANADGLSTSSCSLAPPSGSIRFSGYWPEPPPMPHTTYSKSCTIGSFVNTTSFKLREYNIETVVDAGNRTQLVGTFAIENPGSGDTYRLERMPITADNGVWGGCRAGSGATLPWQLVGCQYVLERRNNRIGFRFQWYCDDRDPSHAILFDATATQILPREVCTTPTDSSSVKQQCTLGAGAGNVSLVVENISWEATSGPMDRGPTLPWI